MNGFIKPNNRPKVENKLKGWLSPHPFAHSRAIVRQKAGPTDQTKWVALIVCVWGNEILKKKEVGRKKPQENL